MTPSADILHHDAAGLDGDAALVLIPALGGDIHFWDDFREAMGPGYPMVALDPRSAGRSPRASEPVSLARHVEDIEALRRELGLERVVPFGCAIGAMAAAAYAARHPRHTQALILSNPALRTTEPAGVALTERAAKVRSGGMSAILPAALERAFLEQPRDERFQRYYDHFAAQDAEAYALSCLAAVGADLSDILGEIDCPTLILAGGHDVLLPAEQSDGVHALVPGSRLEVIAEGAHFLPYQQPRRVAELVRGFLAETGRIR